MKKIYNLTELYSLQPKIQMVTTLSLKCEINKS